VAEAAIAAARREDDLIFNGVPGLLTIEGAHQRQLSAWDEVGAAAKDVIQAITALDESIPDDGTSQRDDAGASRPVDSPGQNG